MPTPVNCWVTDAGSTGGLKIGDVVPEATDQLRGCTPATVAGNNITVTPGVAMTQAIGVFVNETEGWIRIDTVGGGGGGGSRRRPAGRHTHHPSR